MKGKNVNKNGELSACQYHHTARPPKISTFKNGSTNKNMRELVIKPFHTFVRCIKVKFKFYTLLLYQFLQGFSIHIMYWATKTFPITQSYPHVFTINVI